jgi:hypothetical protein
MLGSSYCEVDIRVNGHEETITRGSRVDHAITFDNTAYIACVTSCRVLSHLICNQQIGQVRELKTRSTRKAILTSGRMLHCLAASGEPYEVQYFTSAQNAPKAA